MAKKEKIKRGMSAEGAVVVMIIIIVLFVALLVINMKLKQTGASAFDFIKNLFKFGGSA